METTSDSDSANNKLAEEYWNKVIYPNIQEKRVYKMKRATDIDLNVISHLLRIVQDNGVTTYTSHKMIIVNGVMVKMTIYRFSI